MNLPLEGIQVLDLSRMLPGPYCSMLLGDFGANVLKIERPSASLVKLEDEDEGLWKFAKATNLMTDRNKRSMTLNLKSYKGRAIFLKLCKKADVILEGFRPGVAKRLSISYDIIQKENPEIIYCSISSYGQDGPYRERIGHDINSLAVSGALSLTGKPDDCPVMPGLLVGDVGAGGLIATVSILLAILWREKSQKGQYIDISLTDGLLSFMLPFLGNFLKYGEKSPRGETLSSGGFPGYNVYKTKDNKYVAFGNSEPQHWKNFCKKLGREDFIEHQLSTGKKREEIFSVIRKVIATKNRDQWLQDMEGEDICISPVNEIDEVLSDPQIRFRDPLAQISNFLSEKPVSLLRVPMKMSETPGEIKTPAPKLGEHTKEVLLEIGYSRNEISKLKEEKVV